MNPHLLIPGSKTTIELQQLQQSAQKLINQAITEYQMQHDSQLSSGAGQVGSKNTSIFDHEESLQMIKNYSSLMMKDTKFRDNQMIASNGLVTGGILHSVVGG